MSIDGLVIVMVGVSVPSIIDAMLNLIGQTTSGLALLVGLHNPLASEGVAAVAQSSAVIATMLAPRYTLYQSEAASMMLASSVLMLVVIHRLTINTGAPGPPRCWTRRLNSG